MQSGTLLLGLGDLLTVFVDARVLGLHLAHQLHRLRSELLSAGRGLQELLCDQQLHQLRERERLQGVQTGVLRQRHLWLHRVPHCGAGVPLVLGEQHLEHLLRDLHRLLLPQRHGQTVLPLRHQRLELRLLP